MKKKLRKILNIVVDVMVIMILIVSIFTVVISLTAKSQGVPNVFGKAPLTVLSSSMEDTISVNDVIISDVIPEEERFDSEYKVGDIVTFPITIDGYKELNTHRIVEIVDIEGKPWKEGEIKYYRTQGDNKKTNPEPDTDLQSGGTIVAKYNGTKISGVGAIFSFLRTQLGFFLCILLPMIIFFLYQAVRVVLNAMAYSKEKGELAAREAIANADLTEEQKQRAIAEYLAAQQGAEAAGEATPEQAPAAEESEDA